MTVKQIISPVLRTDNGGVKSKSWLMEGGCRRCVSWHPRKHLHSVKLFRARIITLKHQSRKFNSPSLKELLQWLHDMVIKRWLKIRSFSNYTFNWANGTIRENLRLWVFPPFAFFKIYAEENKDRKESL